MKIDRTREILEKLLEMAINAQKSEDVLRLTQAACNASNAYRCLLDCEQIDASLKENDQ